MELRWHSEFYPAYKYSFWTGEKIDNDYYRRSKPILQFKDEAGDWKNISDETDVIDYSYNW